ncbi:hypothetical protein [Sphingomonas sp.]|uniref:hypothetical protein n=1 Tax=Sphingomonas sp. TaxID=28214 RepID=UPI0031D392DC
MPFKQVSVAVFVCGTLDIAYAILTVMLKGGTAAMVLRGVASGPFGEAANGWGTGGAILGLAVHFAIMTVMVAAYFLLATHTKLGAVSPWVAGAGYGLALYAFMYFVVLPLRWPTIYPQTDAIKIAISLFPHIALVGIPLALIASRRLDLS